MSCWLALQIMCFMHEPPPCSFQHAFHAALEGVWACLHHSGSGSESLFSVSLLYKESGSSSAAILNDGHLSQAPPWTAPIVRLLLPGARICPLSTSTLCLCPAPQAME